MNVLLTLSALCAPAGRLQLPGTVGAGPPAEDPGLLLRQHPLHEVVLQDRGALL